jgi:hypothetical protein
LGDRFECLTETTGWSSGTSGSKTTSFDQNYSFGTDISVTAAWGVKGLGILGGNGTLNLSGSFGFSDLNKSTTDLGKSTGIGVQKPGNFLEPPNYEYHVTPYIFGTVKPSTSVDKTNPDPADVQTFGILRTAFAVDPTEHSAGGWWKQTYSTAPDVALNHPSRWSFSQEKQPDNCRPTCVALSSSLPDNPWLSLFHFMKGLFITNELSPGQVRN